MKAETLITMNGVGKRFSKGFEHSHKTLGQELATLFWGGTPKTPLGEDPEAFWALRDINIEVRRGEVLGVIGHNGAGKTTLLRMLNGEMAADSGEFVVRGQRSSLIDLTGGFSQTMSGRENIYFRGAHLGFDRDFLHRKEQEILDFAELGDFIDSPIKGYSSGMLLRLGFAVTVLAEPDVLLVDEVLAVGDFLFAAKCMRKLNEVRKRAAIVQVSHTMTDITNFSDKVLVLDRGVPVFYGDPAGGVAHYIELEERKATSGVSRLSRNKEAPAIDASSVGAVEALVSEPAAPEKVQNDDELSTNLIAARGEFLYNHDAIEAVRCWWCDADGAPVEAFHGQDRAFLRVSFKAVQRIEKLTVGVPIWSEDGVYVTCCATHARPIQHVVEAGAEHLVTLRIEALHLNKGRYFPVISILSGGAFMYRNPGPVLEVASNRAVLGWGMMTLDYEWTP